MHVHDVPFSKIPIDSKHHFCIERWFLLYNNHQWCKLLLMWMWSSIGWFFLNNIGHIEWNFTWNLPVCKWIVWSRAPSQSWHIHQLCFDITISILIITTSGKSFTPIVGYSICICMRISRRTSWLIKFSVETKKLDQKSFKSSKILTCGIVDCSSSQSKVKLLVLADWKCYMHRGKDQSSSPPDVPTCIQRFCSPRIRNIDVLLFFIPVVSRDFHHQNTRIRFSRLSHIHQ